MQPNGCPGWGAAKSCDSPKTCTGPSGSASCTCPTTCTLGAKQCGASGGAQECVMIGACPGWTSETPCQAVANGTTRCASGQCVVACNGGYRDCNPTASGCETSISDDVMNCGGCNLRCLPNSSCANEVCTSQIGFPVKDCGAGLSAFQDYLFGFSIDVPKPATLTSFGAIPQADGTWNLALYTDSGDKPDRLVAQTGDRSMVAYGGALEFQVTPTQIAAGKYWLMIVRHSGSGAICMSTTASQIRLWQTSSVSGDLPDPYPPASADTYVSFREPWNVYIIARLPGS